MNLYALILGSIESEFRELLSSQIPRIWRLMKWTLLSGYQMAGSWGAINQPFRETPPIGGCWYACIYIYICIYFFLRIILSFYIVIVFPCYYCYHYTHQIHPDTVFHCQLVSFLLGLYLMSHCSTCGLYTGELLRLKLPIWNSEKTGSTGISVLHFLLFLQSLFL